ncbi:MULTISPECIES: hypothetical protein [unclassified Myroides]|uniref:hypothetical protein n=1 Tax=unclassified Myroides TaxID=2642485 RepID=UPI003D2F52B8
MKNKKKFTYFIVGILAISLLVLIVQTQYIKTTRTTSEANLGTFTNPEIAYQECKSILTEVSKALNTGDTTN